MAVAFLMKRVSYFCVNPNGDQIKLTHLNATGIFFVYFWLLWNMVCKVS